MPIGVSTLILGGVESTDSDGFYSLVFSSSFAFAVNDYTLTANTQCPINARIPLPCGSCGPNWGDLQDCESQCNARSHCTDIVYYSDKVRIVLVDFALLS